MDSGNKTALLLKRHNLNTTQVRVRILDVLLSCQSALTQAEIETGMQLSENRVTVYRVLKDFEQAGLVHRIGSPAGKVMFALCQDVCSHGNHQDEHIHFSCTTCEKVYCIEGYVLPVLKFPEGYTVNTVQIIAEGICKECGKNINI